MAEELKVWHDGRDWAIAESADEAARMIGEMTGNDDTEGEDFEALDPDSKLRILCVDGKPDDHGDSIEKTCAEWIAQEGKGILCSEDF